MPSRAVRIKDYDQGLVVVHAVVVAQWQRALAAHTRCSGFDSGGCQRTFQLVKCPHSPTLLKCMNCSKRLLVTRSLHVDQT